MKNKLFYVIVFSMLFLSACPGFKTGGYAPLYKYRMFPIQKVGEVVRGLQDEVFSEYAKVKVPVYRSYSGIISNSNYVVLATDGKTFVHVFVTNNKWTNTTIYQFTDTNGITKIAANRCYVVYLSNDVLRVIRTNGNVVWQKTVNPTNLILAMANGTNALFAYGEEKMTLFQGNDNYGDPTNYYIYAYNHDVVVVDIDRFSTNIIANIQGINGFTPHNKYLFFHTWNGLRTGFLGTWRSCDWETDTHPAVYDYGILAYYDLSTHQYHNIGDLAHEQKYGGDWSDFTIGITVDLRSFYVYEDRFNAYAIGWHLEDGRTVDEEHGIWRIDISSLGLSE